MKITFLGAAGNVTGSRFLISAGQESVLIDCGLFQERALRGRNWDAFPVPPGGIDAVLLTHAHIDHCGYLPKLVREGFSGRIYGTAPTVDIARVSLLDSARIQEYDAQLKKKRHRKEGRSGKYPEVPLYTVEDAREVMPLFQKIDYSRTMPITPQIRATWHEAGHILGSAMIELEVTDTTGVKRIIFSGDIGRRDRPVLKDPHLFESADYVVMEATYGDRTHEVAQDADSRLEEVIHATVERGGNVVIPAFAIGRTQELLYAFNRLLKAGRIPHLVTFVDSPMAINVTDIFKEHPDLLDAEARAFLERYRELFDFPLLKMTASSEESKSINHIKGSAIIMAGSGMCTGGRIKHHLLQNISRPESTILFVGYQAVGTLGRTILEKPQEVRIFGGMRDVRARIERINGFSAHADRDELIMWLEHIGKKPQQVFIVHAESDAAAAFADLVRERYTPNVVIPQYQQTFEL